MDQLTQAFSAITRNLWAIGALVGLRFVEVPLQRTMMGIVPDPFGPALTLGLTDTARFTLWEAFADKSRTVGG